MTFDGSLQARADAYNETLGKKWPGSVIHVDGPAKGRQWLQAVWVLGNDYRNKTPYYGAYPPNYLERIMGLFPEAFAARTLHLFAGSVTAPGWKLDVRPNGHDPMYVQGQATQLNERFHSGHFDLILADPPYSAEDAVHYGTPMPNRKAVVHECAKVTASGGFLVWLDTVLPMYRKAEWEQVGLIAIQRSTQHRFRCVALFRRTKLKVED